MNFNPMGKAICALSFFLGASPCMAQSDTSDENLIVYLNKLFVYLNQFSWIFIIPLVLCAAYLVWAWKTRVLATAERDPVLANLSHEDQDLILIMAGLAKSDGAVVQIEVRTISNIFWAITGIGVSDAQVRQVIASAGSKFDRVEFRDLGKNFSAEKRSLFLKSLFEVMVADGRLRPEEETFINSVCKHVGISQAVFDSVWMEFQDDIK